MTSQAYPLKWPKHRKRTPVEDRRRSRFTRSTPVAGQTWKRQTELPLFEAIKRLDKEADRINAEYLVISTNMVLRNDGLPRADQRPPADPGVCAYFFLEGKEVAMPCDTYDTVAGNVAAIAAHIEATRTMTRHGVASVSEMFSGFAALPPPPDQKPVAPWFEVLGLPRGKYSKEVIETIFRDKAKSCHPDAGGSAEAMTELNRARHEALQ